ncbi:hypothetical protein NDU88_004609 [Pleurodeles waltl]|uniref:Uncharacterized protein n=1 Tax=Pleurodeles waltl TaxID=8319 RepID=A0AAV7TSG0_PLEWA|nr:hypothetical protein NDU88_004609 [Pleurodeles waltl]
MPQSPNLTPERQLGPVAEHAHGDAARLRPSHDRGWNCGPEQMKTELLGNCYSITPNAGMLKRDPADSEEAYETDSLSDSLSQLQEKDDTRPP